MYSVGMANASKKTSSKNSPKTSKTKTVEKRADATGKQKKVRVVSSKVVYRAPVFQVTSDEVVEPSGVKARRDIIRHPGSVVILALDERKSKPSVLLIQQYRYAANQELWELPAGRIDEGEDALDGGQARTSRGNGLLGIGVETSSVLLRKSRFFGRDDVDFRGSRPAQGQSFSRRR